MRIDGGVYLGRRPREAIVVDTNRQDSAILRAYGAMLQHVQDKADQPGQRTPSPAAAVASLRKHLAADLPEAMRAMVARDMPYDESVVRAVASEHQLKADDKVHLDVYLRGRGGVCRHQVCFVGVVLELLVRDGWLRGEVSLERKHVPGWFSHAWVRFIDAHAVEWVFDPAQGLYARLAGMDGPGQAFYGREVLATGT